MRLTTACRAKALEAGLWQSHDGRMVSVAKMAGPHLVNALLQSLEALDPMSITEPLAREVHRRGLEAVALAEAARRMMHEMGSGNRGAEPYSGVADRRGLAG